MEKNKLRELVEQARMGNKWAMSSLFEEYKHPVRGVCRTMVHDQTQAERIADEAFDKAFNQLGELDKPEDFLPWVTQIAREKCGAIRISTGTALKTNKQTALRKAEKSTALDKHRKGGALSTDVIYPQTAAAEPAGRKSKTAGIIIAVSAVIVLALAAGVAVLFFGRRDLPAIEAPDGELLEYIFVSDDNVLRGYAEFFDSHYSVDDDKVCFADVTNDGREEMLVIDRPNNEESWLYIYTLGSGRVEEIYNVNDNGPLESMGIVALCEYEGKQCMYERVVYSWTENGSYEESIFYLDENGGRVELARWDETTDAEALTTGIFHFNDFDEIRNLGVWAQDAFVADQ